MAKCQFTGKKRATGNTVSHAKNRNKRVFGANIQKIKIKDENGTTKRVTIAAGELKSRNEILKPAPRKVILAELKKQQNS